MRRLIVGRVCFDPRDGEKHRAGPGTLPLLTLWRGFADDCRYVSLKLALIGLLLLAMAMLEVVR